MGNLYGAASPPHPDGKRNRSWRQNKPFQSRKLTNQFGLWLLNSVLLSLSITFISCGPVPLVGNTFESDQVASEEATQQELPKMDPMKRMMAETQLAGLDNVHRRLEFFTDGKLSYTEWNIDPANPAEKITKKFEGSWGQPGGEDGKEIIVGPKGRPPSKCKRKDAQLICTDGSIITIYKKK